jgi:hypothetical protein
MMTTVANTSKIVSYTSDTLGDSKASVGRTRATLVDTGDTRTTIVIISDIIGK